MIINVGRKASKVINKKMKYKYYKIGFIVFFCIAINSIIIFYSCNENQSAAQIKPDGAKIQSMDDAYQCKYITEKITIDGKLQEPAWNEATPIVDFYYLGTDKKAQNVTRAWLLWDNEYLYLAIVSKDTDIWSEITTHDGPLWDGDVVELFIKPSHDNPTYYEFEINPLGITFDAEYPMGRTTYNEMGILWESGLRVASSIDGTLGKRNDKDISYTVEAAIPIKSLNGGEVLKPGTIWTFAVCRYDYMASVPKPILYMSSPGSTYGFHGFEVYKKINFMEQ